MQGKAKIAIAGVVVLLLLPGVLQALTGAAVSDGVIFYALGLGAALIGLWSTTTYLHREVAHRAITLAAPVKMVCRIAVFIISGMKPREWAGVHLRHHQKSDKPGDPHSPLQHGFWMVFLLTGVLYHRAKRWPEVKRLAEKIPTDKWDKWIFDRGIIGPLVALPLIQLLGLLAGYGLSVSLLLVLAVWPYSILIYLLVSGAINGNGHTAAATDLVTKDRSKNINKLYEFLAGGENNHHNHHLKPKSAKFGKWWQDPAWSSVIVLKRLGLCTVHRAHAW